MKVRRHRFFIFRLVLGCALRPLGLKPSSKIAFSIGINFIFSDKSRSI